MVNKTNNKMVNKTNNKMVNKIANKTNIRLIPTMDKSDVIWIIDTETTGLPKQPGYGRYFLHSKTSAYDSSRMVQICIMEYDRDMRYIKKYNWIIKPKGFSIKNEKFHGISEKRANAEGVDISTVINLLKSKISNIKLIVAHNVSFDVNVIGSEIYRNGHEKIAEAFCKVPRYCTSFSTKGVLKIKMKYSDKYKEPKLVELYDYLFDKPPPKGLHDAGVDCQVLAECFAAMVEKGMIRMKNQKGHEVKSKKRYHR